MHRKASLRLVFLHHVAPLGRDSASLEIMTALSLWVEPREGQEDHFNRVRSVPLRHNNAASWEHPEDRGVPSLPYQIFDLEETLREKVSEFLPASAPKALWECAIEARLRYSALASLHVVGTLLFARKNPLDWLLRKKCVVGSAVRSSKFSPARTSMVKATYLQLVLHFLDTPSH